MTPRHLGRLSRAAACVGAMILSADGVGARPCRGASGANGALVAKQADPELAAAAVGRFVLVRDASALAEVACAPAPIANAALADAVSRVQASLGLDAQLAVVLTTAPPSCNGIYYVPLANDVRGIGYAHLDARDTFDDTPNSRLEGVAFLNDWPYWRERRAEFASAFNHELGHRWVGRVHAWLDERSSHELLGRELAHWSYFLDTGGSPLEGNRWVAGHGTFESDTPRYPVDFSDLDLYLMGVLPASEVAPFWLLRDAVGASRDCLGDALGPASPPQTCGSVRLEARAERVSIEDIVRVEGARVPAATPTPKALDTLVVVLESGAAALSAESCRELSAEIETRFADFERATLGRIELVEVGLAAGDCDSLDVGEPSSVLERETRASPAAAACALHGMSNPPAPLRGRWPVALGLLLLVLRRARPNPVARSGRRHGKTRGATG